MLQVVQHSSLPANYVVDSRRKQQPCMHILKLLSNTDPSIPETNVAKPSCNKTIRASSRNSIYHSTEGAVGGNRLSRAASSIVAGGWLTVPEGKTNEQAFTHRLFSISHIFKSGLLIVDLLVFGHIGLITEVVKVASVGFRVELWYKGRSLRTKCCPVDLGEVLMTIDCLN